MKKLYLKKAYDEAKKDKDGYVFLEVRFNYDDVDVVIPMKGKLSCPNADVEVDNEYDESEEAFTSKWILKDIPECTEYVKSYCDNDAETLYWNPYDEVWCFEDMHDAEFNDKYDIDEDYVFERIIDKIDNIASELNLFQIDVDKYSDFIVAEDDDTVSNSEVDVDVNTTYHSDVNDIVELHRTAICDVEKAKKNHKKIPYTEVGNAVRKLISGLTDTELGKMFANGFTSH